MPDVDIYSYTDQAGTKYHFRDGRTQYKTYDSVTDLSLTSGSATIAGAWSALPGGSILICPAENFVIGTGGVPNTYGTVEMVRYGASRGWIYFHGKGPTNGEYRMFLNSSNAPDGTWVPMSTYTATETFSPNTNYTLYANNHISFVKCGRIVQISGYIYPTNQVPAFGSLGTAPAGFRPKIGTSLQLIPAGRSTFPYWVYLDTAGVAGVQDVALPANINYYVSATYIIS